MMKKYRWKKDFAIMDDKEQVTKELNLQLYFSQSGIKDCQIIQLFTVIERQLLQMLKEENLTVGKEIMWEDNQQGIKSPEGLFGKY